LCNVLKYKVDELAKLGKRRRTPSFASNIHTLYSLRYCINIIYCVYPAKKAKQSYQSIDG